MPSIIAPWITADDLQGIAKSTTSIVIALLSLLAVAVLVYGFIFAIVNNRRIQIVVADLVAPDSSAELTEATQLSSVARQYVEHEVSDLSDQVIRIGRTMLIPASPDLEPRLDSGAVERVQRAAADSIATLSAALRAVAPDSADRFLGLFSVILPPPRGLSVTLVLLRRGTDAAPQMGAAVEVVELGGRAVASTVIWEAADTFSPTPSTQPGVTDRILVLLRPVARWIAVRLVVTVMVSSRRGIASQARQGLKRLLAGGLFLASERHFPSYALTFGEEAINELGQARKLMPGLTLPVEMLAGVHERIGWAHQSAGKFTKASDAFRAAAGLWEEAEELTHNSTDAGKETKLLIFLDRKLKAQLEVGEPALCSKALAGIQSLSTVPALRTDSRFLYNRSCLYAQASKVDQRADYQRHALRWLGLALLCDPSLWDFPLEDPALAPIHGLIDPYLTCLRSLSPQDRSQHGEAAEELVARALGRTLGLQRFRMLRFLPFRDALTHSDGTNPRQPMRPRVGWLAGPLRACRRR